MTLQNPLLRNPSRPLPRCVVVVGAGTIGPDIGYYLKSALPDLKLYLVDIAQPALDRAMRRFGDYADKAVARRKMSASEAGRSPSTFSPVPTTTSPRRRLGDRGGDREPRAQAPDFRAARSAGATGCLDHVEHQLASGGADLRRTAAQGARHGHAFLRAGLAQPGGRGDRLAGRRSARVAHLRRIFCATGKVPLVTADAPCFMLDRVFDNWCNEAALLLDRATAAEIDSDAAEFVHAGPFFVLNLARGNPIIVETNTLQADEEGDHYRPAGDLPLGRELGHGRAGRRQDGRAETAVAIRERLLGVLFSQTADILDRAIGEAADLDLGCRVALGFKRGPLELLRAMARRTQAGSSSASPRAARNARAEPASARLPALHAPRSGRRPRRHQGDHAAPTRGAQCAARRDDRRDSRRDPALRDRCTVIGFVIVGYGTRAFCAGADIGRFPTLWATPRRPRSTRAIARGCSSIWTRMDKPVVAALNGMALGGGFELAMRCHGLVALRDAWMQFPEITLGILPGIGAMVVPVPPLAGCRHHFPRHVAAGARSSRPPRARARHRRRLADDYARCSRGRGGACARLPGDGTRSPKARSSSCHRRRPTPSPSTAKSSART